MRYPNRPCPGEGVHHVRPFRRGLWAATLLTVGSQAIPAAAFAPVGEPAEVNVIYECTPDDTVLTGSLGIPGFETTLKLWVTKGSQEPPEDYEGSFLWWNPHTDVQFGGFYKRRLDFDIFGDRVKQMLVGPDGAALYLIGTVDDAGKTRFETMQMTCRKGGGY